MIVPEKTQNVKRLVIPSYIFKGGVLAFVFLVVLATVMVLDYANVMSQISENKQLKGENRQLKQQVQIFKDKMLTLESTIDRVKTFATKLRIITNIEERAAPAFNLPNTPNALPGPPPLPQSNPPMSSPNHSQNGPQHDPISEPSAIASASAVASNVSGTPSGTALGGSETGAQPTKATKISLSDLLSTGTESVTTPDTDTNLYVKTEFDKLDRAYAELSAWANQEELSIQDIYERLSDKKAMLMSMPTQIPTDGYVTSGFGIRFSPYGGKRKMHEGLDIANRYGSDIIAPGDGVVVFAGIKPGYGKILAINHGYGLQTYYGHTSTFYVTKGQKIHRGQRLAAVGNTGRSTGPHVHYEIHAHGTPIDPMYYLLDR